MAAPGLCCCVWALSSCYRWEGRTTLYCYVLAYSGDFPVAENRLQGTETSVTMATEHVESSRLGIEPVSPALEGGLLTTGPPGKFGYIFREKY